jgi:poly-gamma-glutamate synthesis protein (capsule biosynthesis protein)
VVQPVRKEYINGKHNLVAYSLGNFISNQQQPNTDVGLMLQVDLVKTAQDIKAELYNYQTIPTWRYIHKRASQKPKFYVLPFRLLETWKSEFPEINPADLHKMKMNLEAVQKRIGQPK